MGAPDANAGEVSFIGRFPVFIVIVERPRVLPKMLYRSHRPDFDLSQDRPVCRVSPARFMELPFKAAGRFINFLVRRDLTALRDRF